MALGAPPQTPGRLRRKIHAGGGAPSYILVRKPLRGSGRSPNRRGPPAPSLATPMREARIPGKVQYLGASPG